MPPPGAGYGAPPPGGYPGAFQGPTVYPGSGTNNSNATTSLILGILSMVFCGIFTGIPAIIVGNKAKREIEATGGVQGGSGSAMAGVILGWISVAMMAFVIVLIIAVTFLGKSTTSKFSSVGVPITPDCTSQFGC